MKNARKARKHLEKARYLLSRIQSPFEDMSNEEIIKKLRKTRQEIWNEKFAPHF